MPSRRRSLQLISLVFTAMVLVSACGQMSMTAEQHYQRSVDLQAQGNLRGALVELRNVLQQDPEHADARLRMGDLSLLLGDPATAASEFERAQRSGADPIAAQTGLVRAQLAMEAHEAALAAVDSALRLFPEAPNDSNGMASELRTLHALRGEALLGLGRTEEAEQALSVALETDPAPVEAQLGMVQLSLARGTVSDARTWAERALESHPDLSGAWASLGDVNRVDGDLPAADAAYTEAIDRSEAPFSLYLNRALLRLERGALDAVEEDLQALRRLDAGHPATSYVEGLLHFQHDRYAEAQIALERSFREGAGYIPAHFFLGASHLAQGHWRQAEQHLRRFLAVVPGSPEATRMLAAVRMQEGDLDRAAPLLETLLQKSSEDARTLSMMGDLYLARGDREGAVAYLRQASIAEPDDARARASLARALLEGGQADEGLRELGTLLELAPENQQAEVRFILQLVQDRRFDEAHEALDRFQADRPANDPMALNLRAAVLAGSGDLQGAVERFNEVLQAAPGDPTAVVNLARIARQSEEFDEARRIYREALEHNPGNLAILLQWAELEAGLDDATAVRQLLEQAVETNPGEIHPRLSLALLAMREGNPRQTLTLLEPLSGTADGDRREVLELLAQAQLALQRNQQAASTLRKLAERVPDSADVRVRLARAFLQAERPTDAKSQLGQALDRDPGHVGALQLLATLEALDGRAAEALVLARRLQEASPGIPEGYALEGNFLAAQGDFAGALKAYQDAYSRAAEPQFALNVGRMLRQLGDDAGAAEFLAGHLALDANQDAVRAALAETRLALGEHKEAIAEYEQLLERHEDSVVVLNNLAYLYQQEADSRALELAEKAHALRPDNPAIADTLGWILVQGGQAERGLELLRSARAGIPDDPGVGYHYAAALAKVGEENAAREELSDLLSGSGEFPQRREAEALLQSLGER